MRNVFCSWISYIVLDWLHEGCEMDLLADFLHFGASVFLLHVGLEQCYFSTKPGSNETNPTLVVEVSNVKFIFM